MQRNVIPLKTKLDIQVDRNLIGIELEKANEVDKAIELYEMNLKQGFDGSHPYTRLAVIYRRRKQYDEEIRVIEKAIKVFKGLNASKDLEYFNKRLGKAIKFKKDSFIA